MSLLIMWPRWGQSSTICILLPPIVKSTSPTHPAKKSNLGLFHLRAWCWCSSVLEYWGFCSQMFFSLHDWVYCIRLADINPPDITLCPSTPPVSGKARQNLQDITPCRIRTMYDVVFCYRKGGYETGGVQNQGVYDSVGFIWPYHWTGDSNLGVMSGHLFM